MARSERNNLWARAHAASPWAALALLVACLFVGGFQPRRIAGTEAYFEEVKAEIETIPYRIGRWVGQDTAVQEAAQVLLRPNKILQRRYVDPLTQQWVTLLIVHCGDARDMNGHYPPVCYPGHGWVLSRRQTIDLEVGRSSVAAMRYEFMRPDETGLGLSSDSMVIANLFVLPGVDGEAVLDMSAVERVARSAERAGLVPETYQSVLANLRPVTATQYLRPELQAPWPRFCHEVARVMGRARQPGFHSVMLWTALDRR